MGTFFPFSWPTFPYRGLGSTYFMLNCCQIHVGTFPLFLLIWMFFGDYYIWQTTCIPHNKNLHHTCTVCCWKVSKAACASEIPRVVAVLPSWNLSLPLVVIFPCMGHEREGLSLGTSVGLPSHNHPHTCHCQSASRAASQGDFSLQLRFLVEAWKDFSHWRLGCSIVAMPPPYFPNPSTVDWNDFDLLSRPL